MLEEFVDPVGVRLQSEKYVAETGENGAMANAPFVNGDKSLMT